MWKNLFSSGALKSKTVWVGIAQLLLPVLTSYLSGGVALTLTDLLPVITGIGTILARAAATQPLATSNHERPRAGRHLGRDPPGRAHGRGLALQVDHIQGV
jgi:hypothetical protein